MMDQLILSRRGLSPPALCRFIPALSQRPLHGSDKWKDRGAQVCAQRTAAEHPSGRRNAQLYEGAGEVASYYRDIRMTKAAEPQRPFLYT